MTVSEDAIGSQQAHGVAAGVESESADDEEYIVSSDCAATGNGIRFAAAFNVVNPPTADVYCERIGIVEFNVFTFASDRSRQVFVEQDAGGDGGWRRCGCWCGGRGRCRSGSRCRG